MTSSVDILDYMLGKFPNLKEAYDFYQNFLLSISNNDVAMLEDILNTLPKTHWYFISPSI